jgi:methyl-accepting chemotaxis protein
MCQPNILDEEKQVYTYDSFADLANKVQSKVNEMTGEMDSKADELDNRIEECNQAKYAFEEIQTELEELIQQINDMGDYETRIDDAVSEADNLIN